MNDAARVSVAIIGSGNIGTDLMIKVMRYSKHLKMGAMVGIDPASDGLARAARLNVPTTHEGIDGLVKLPNFKDIRIAFDATSAGAHKHHNEVLQKHGVQVIDLTPAAIGPYVVPVVNLEANLDSPNINMVTCGGQATIPMVRAVSRVTPVHYGEIVASISSKSAGPGTRANIDEFTETTSQAIVKVGGAKRGKALIILNPAEPPLIMRNTIHCLTEDVPDEEAITRSVHQMVAEVQKYVPGYTLKNGPVFDGKRVTVWMEVAGLGDFLPRYAGNLDIMTAAALRTAEMFAEEMAGGRLVL
jgi:acetaldehyde dehydrogenase